MYDLLLATCRIYGVTVADLLGSSRALGVMAARCALAYALRHAGLSWPVVGRFVGGRSAAAAEALAACAEVAAREDGDAAADLAALCGAAEGVGAATTGAAWWSVRWATAVRWPARAA